MGQQYIPWSFLPWGVYADISNRTAVRWMGFETGQDWLDFKYVPENSGSCRRMAQWKHKS
jgi:hypothetical protein